jgi:two-component system cell cycle response regulator DivK
MTDVEEVSGVRERTPLVLVVDDYLDAQAAYGLWLRRAGYRVAFASSGEQAVAQVKILYPDAVIMDLCLRGSSGWTATREIRKDPRLRRIPILAVSGHAEPELETLAYEAGCDMFVTKTCPVETILSMVHGLIARSAVVLAAAESAAPSAGSAPTVPGEEWPAASPHATEPEARGASTRDVPAHPIG